MGASLGEAYAMEFSVAETREMLCGGIFCHFRWSMVGTAAAGFAQVELVHLDTSHLWLRESVWIFVKYTESLY